MSSLILAIKTTVGTPKEVVADELVVLAQKLGIIIETPFQGIPMYARPTDSLQGVLERWQRDYRLSHYPES